MMSIHKKPNITPQSLTAIDLFSGCGGLSCGLHDAGFRVVAAVEIDSKAQATYKMNHPGVRLYAQDIRMLAPQQLMNDAGLAEGELDLLAGCPPCQGFSRLRTKNQKASVEDDRNDLVAEFIRFAKVLQPKTIMLENVPALAKDSRFTRVRNQLSSLGYKMEVHVLDAADYEVPQRRKRLIMLASRVHTPQIAPKAKSRVTVRQALAGIGAPSRTKDKLHGMGESRSQTVRDLIALIPKNGGSRSDLGRERQLDCHKRSDGFKDVYGRMAWDDVSPTITSGCHNPSKGRFLHPSYNRAITLREAALLQGFPRSFIFDTSHGKEAIALMIGNALPPPFIAAHAGALRDGLVASRGKSART
ncbi:DNA cytosine methyltransferase [Achromobacter xylosoxidans]|uniref:DNA cytosine methyltransferase n=1 Tax=Alcaligenes xylosoxydans xylosoxydans TaxID=85698 RepID=UPI001F30F4AB|nr:DNA cytosine methyltransferase [Achromobacter xylosoxidans]UXL05870.1 DNA cytosine methyltransferase [Achromobacter xylosoxidans]